MVLDDYGTLDSVARVVEESLSNGELSHCEPLGRSSGEAIPHSAGLRFLGPEAVLCAAAALARPGRPPPGRLGLHGRTFELCAAPCDRPEHVLTRLAGRVNFSEPPGAAGHGASAGGLAFSALLGGGRGRWRQPRPGALMALASFQGRDYLFAFLPDLTAFQANEVLPEGGVGRMVFKATQVSQISPGWFGEGSTPIYRASPVR